QLVGREPLNAKAVEEPRRIGRDIRWLIGPVIEVVVAEQTDIGDENPSIDVEPVIYVKVISAVGFGAVFICAAKVLLSASWAGSVERRCHAEPSIHGQYAAADVLPMEVTSKADLLDLEFVRAKDLGRAAHGVVTRMIEAVDKMGVEADLRREEFRVP